MEYLPLVNRSVATPVQTLTSSRPPVILPLPSAVKVPARVKKLPCPEQSSLPLMEKAYCPARLALENFAAGGGGVGLELDLAPPHASTKNAGSSETSTVRRFLKRLTVVHFPPASFVHP